MNKLHRPTLLGAARAHWRSFAPAWIFPFVFLYGGLAADKVGHPLLFFCIVAAPLFFWTFTRASSPWRKREISYWQGVFWSIAVPFLLWTFATVSRAIVS